MESKKVLKSKQIMETKKALEAFSALSLESRLDIFRLLIKAGANGALAGEISEQLGVLQNTLSTNLNILVNAGLVHRARQGRSVRYTAEFDGIRALLGFLLQDCCGGKPELCSPIIAEIICAC